MTDAVAIVIGGGGIGAALVASLVEGGRFGEIHALSRQPMAAQSPIHSGTIDIGDQASIRQAAARIAGPVDLIIVATGMLHDADRMPERALKELDGAALARIFQVNTIGPALALRYFSPLLRRDQRSAFALLSARVGSITDNRSGGWYGYRASKAALNMIVRSAAIELARTRPAAICVSLHPGTVDTPLSRPFQTRVPAGQLFEPRIAARQLLTVIDGLETSASGQCFDWRGDAIAP